MKKITALVAVGMACWPVAAQADYPPTSAELEWARAKAVAYWHVPQPPCGRESVTVDAQAFTGGPEFANGPAWGMALEASCTIVLNPTGVDWLDFPEVVCRVYVHEFGHLVLGTNYFAATNPGDPAHSPDPTNIMYGGGEPGDGPAPTEAQEHQQNVSAGCYLPPEAPSRAFPSKRKRHRHHHHHVPTSSPLPLP